MHAVNLKYLLPLDNIIFCIKRPVCSCLNDLFLFCASRIYYSSEAANVKIFSVRSKNPTENELDIDDEEDIDNIGENEPVFKS